MRILPNLLVTERTSSRNDMPQRFLDQTDRYLVSACKTPVNAIRIGAGIGAMNDSWSTVGLTPKRT